MKGITNRDIAELIELLDAAEELRPIVVKAINVLVGFGPELGTLMGNLTRGVANVHTEYFTQLVSNGFSREEALALMINTSQATTNILTALKAFSRKKS